MNIPNRVMQCDKQNFLLTFENISDFQRYECFIRTDTVKEYNLHVFHSLEKKLKKLIPDMKDDINILSVAQGVEVDIAYEVGTFLNKTCHLEYSEFTMCTQVIPDYVEQLLEGDVSLIKQNLTDLPASQDKTRLLNKVTDYVKDFPAPLKEDNLEYASVVKDDYGKLLNLRYTGEKEELRKHLSNWNPLYDVENKGYLSFAVPLSDVKVTEDVPYSRQSAQIYVMSENHFILGEVPPEYFRFTRSDIELVYDVKNRYVEKDRMASALSFAIEKVARECSVKSFLIGEREVNSDLSLLDFLNINDQKNRFMLEGYLKENVSVTIEVVIEIVEFNKEDGQNSVIQIASKISLDSEHSITLQNDSFSVADFTSANIQSAVFEEITTNDDILSKYGLSNLTNETLLPVLRSQNIFPPMEKKPLIGGREEGVGDKAIPVKVSRSKNIGRRNKDVPKER